MPRELWKGAIQFGLVHIPVSLFPAEQREELSFTMLDRRDLQPVGYKRFNKTTGDEVPYEQIVKGYELDEGHYVTLEKDDFKRANVEATQTVDIMGFIDADQVPNFFYESPYYLAPGKHGDKGYALLRETLVRSHRVGLATVVIRTRQHIAALYPVDNLLVLNTLRFPGERLATFTTSFGADKTSEYLVVGTKGSLRVDPAYELADGLEQHVRHADRTRHVRFEKRDQFAPEILYFSECVLEDREPEPSGEEGLADVRVIRALYRSAQLGRPVKLEPRRLKRQPNLRQSIRKPPVRMPRLVHAAAPGG